MALGSASCVWIKNTNKLSGVFTFQGNGLIKGIIKREIQEMFGDQITFYSENLGEFRFLSNYTVDKPRITFSALIDKFKVPELTTDTKCWKADAEIVLKNFTLIIDETDYSGIYMNEFKPTKLGLYKPCSAH
jgi:hypothetical protein